MCIRDRINPDGSYTFTPLPGMAGTDSFTYTIEDEFGNESQATVTIGIADLAIAKEVVGTPVLLGDGNYEATYQIVVLNNGAFDLHNLSLVEDLATQFGNALVSAGDLRIVSTTSDPGSSIAIDSSWNGSSVTEFLAAGSTLATGDSFTLEFTTVVDANEFNSLTDAANSVTGSGQAIDENGDPITNANGEPVIASDLSDSGSDPLGTNPGEPGDTFGSDDPTLLVLPSLGIAKSAGVAVPNGDNFDVTFTIVVENNGTVTLDNLSLTDDIMAEFGNAFVDTSGITVGNFSGTGTAPTANDTWDGDTSLNMLVGGSLDVGDSFEVSFTVTIDPDGIDSVAQALSNQATGGGNAVNLDGTPLTDDSGNPIMATDVSDNGTDPNGENVEDNMDGIAGNDPTPLLIADLGIAKSAIGTPLLLANGNYAVNYQVVVENTGTVNLAGISLLEDLSTQFGGAFVTAGGVTLVTPPAGLSSTITPAASFDGAGATDLIDLNANSILEVGDSFTLTFMVEVDPSAIAAGDSLANSVTGSADAVDANGDPITDPAGNPIVANDISDSGADPSTTNPDQPGDTFGSDDPTPLQIPSIGIAKSAGTPVPNGENFDITFTLVIENNGSVPLNGISVFDDIASELGGTFVDVSDLAVTNFAGSGSAPFANADWLADTTQSLVTGGTLEVGDVFEVVFTATIDPDVAGTSAGLSNQASALGTALDANGDPITDDAGNPIVATDDSDNGTDPASENSGEETEDGVFGNDPTPILIADLGIAKQIVGEPVLSFDGNATFTFQVVVENTGTVDLTNLSLIEDLESQFGSLLVEAGNLTLVSGPSDAGSSITLNSAGFDGSGDQELVDASATNLLAVGDSFVVEFTATIDALGLEGPLENQVTGTASGVDSNGNVLIGDNGQPMLAGDISDNGVDPNGENGEDNGDGTFGNDPTLVDIAIDPTGFFYDSITGQILTGGSVSVVGPSGTSSVNLVDAGADGSYQFFGTEPGRYVVAVTPPAGFVLDTDTLLSGAFDPTGQGNPVLLGSDDVNLDGALDDSTVTQYFLEFDLEAGDPAVFFNNLPFIQDGTTGNPGSFFGSGGGGGGSAPRLSGIGGPGQIFSSSALRSGTTTNPLSLDSSFAGGGGFSGEGFGLFGDDGCCDPCADQCGTPETLQSEQFIVEPDCGTCDSNEPIQPEIIVDSNIDMEMPRTAESNLLDAIPESEEEFAGDEQGSDDESDDNSDSSNGIIHAAELESGHENSDNKLTRKPSFLKRLHDWLNNPFVQG